MLTATAVLIPATFIALVISFALARRLPLMPVITTGMVLVFGALTLWLQDKTFIEIKLTIIYCMFGAALLGSMAFGKLLLPIVLDAAFHLDAAGWRTLTVRWGLFFFALAALNEILRHALSWDRWVTSRPSPSSRSRSPYIGTGAADYASRDQGRPISGKCEACRSRRASHGTEERWLKLTWRWAFFLVSLAILKEVVWSDQSTDLWVEFKSRQWAMGADQRVSV